LFRLYAAASNEVIRNEWDLLQLRNHLADLETLLVEKERLSVECTNHIQEREMELESLGFELANAKERFNEIQNSLLWRLTVPLRQLLDRLSR
jgi:hypothetical protein